jgi:hypothetical protein
MCSERNENVERTSHVPKLRVEQAEDLADRSSARAVWDNDQDALIAVVGGWAGPCDGPGDGVRLERAGAYHMIELYTGRQT